MVWESCDVVRFDLGSLLQGQTMIPKLKMLITRLILVLDVCNVTPTYSQGQRRIAKLKSAYNLLIISPRGLQCETNL